MRYAAAGAVLWTVAYGFLYLRVVTADDGSPAWWYVAVLVLAVVALLPACAGNPAAIGLGLGMTLLAAAVVVGLASVGLLLAPAAAAAAVAFAIGRTAVTATTRPVQSSFR